MTDIQTVFDAIRREREYQDKKYGTPEQRKLGIGDYVVIAESEMAEVRYDIIHNSPEYAIQELVQVAAVIVAALELHGVRER